MSRLTVTVPELREFLEEIMERMVIDRTVILVEIQGKPVILMKAFDEKVDPLPDRLVN